MSENDFFPMRYRGNIAIIDLNDRITGGKARKLQDQLLYLKNSGISIVILNFQEVLSIDSLGASAVLEGVEIGLIIKIIKMDSNCRETFKQYDKNNIIPLLGSEEEALVSTNGAPVIKNEMRKFDRVNTNIPIEISLGTRHQPGVLLNVSKGGALVGYMDRLSEEQNSIRSINIKIQNVVPLSIIELQGKPVRFGKNEDMDTIAIEFIQPHDDWGILKQAL